MSESQGAARAWRVLIADDESLIRLDLREMLTELGYDVIGEAGDVVKPFRPAELLPVIELSVARFEEFRSLEREVGDLREALETRKVVERAKGVLMETHGLREADAFHRIRKTSMDTRKSMREVAEAVLLAHEMERSGVE